MLKRIAQHVQPSKPLKITNIPVPIHNTPQIIETVEGNLMYSPAEIGYIKGTIQAGWPNPNADKVLTLSSQGLSPDEIELVESEKEQIKKSKVISIPGLGGGDSSRMILRTLFDFRKIFPTPSLSIFSPRDGDEKEARYMSGLDYYFNEGHINEAESRKFFEKVLASKITDEKGKLLKPESIERFILMGFSIGSREMKSHVNYLGEYLISHGVEREDVQKYFDRFVMVNVGGPVNWRDRQRALYSPSPRTVHVLSITDFGTKKPDELMRAVFLDEESHKEGVVTKFNRPFMNPGRELLVVLGAGIVPNGKMVNGVFVANKLGHNLNAYADAISSNETTTKLFDILRDFVENEISDEQLEKRFVDFSRDAKRYEYDRDLKEEDVMRLVKTWQLYCEDELAAETLLAKISKLFGRTAPSGDCERGKVVNLAQMEKNKKDAESNER